VANGEDGTVQVFDGSSYGLLKTVGLGSDADNVRFDPERKEIYVGYGAGALAILAEDGTKLGNIRLDAHPESFQVERSGSRIFVNLPDSRKVAVVDRNTHSVIANWSTEGALANFPMALDEQDHRLFIVCRKPAQLLVLNTDTGAEIAKLSAVNDCDDVFFDFASKSLTRAVARGASPYSRSKTPISTGKSGRSTPERVREQVSSHLSLIPCTSQPGNETARLPRFTSTASNVSVYPDVLQNRLRSPCKNHLRS
jgi:DNA-binding beta-propeller fold protein YncE